MNSITKLIVIAVSLSTVMVVGGCTQPGEQVVRGYFGLGDHEQVVHVTSSSDFYVDLWARNVETFKGGVQISTPPSQFRTSGSSGPQDGLVLDVAPQTGVDLGSVGARGGETIDIANASGARVTVFLTVHTAPGATVDMTWE
jgi:hypothetical protein